MNKYQQGMKILCEIPAITRQKMICTVQKQVGKTVVADLPCVIKGFKTIQIDIGSIVEIIPPPAPKTKTKPPPAPPDSPYGRLKETLKQIATNQPYTPPPTEQPPPAPIIESKPESKPIMSSCIFQLLSEEDLSPEEIKLMKQLQKENK
tara:strand:+ start:1135 stop:1581 length:447 start_codon:yes stop_codon:yes gene_type:complete